MWIVNIDWTFSRFNVSVVFSPYTSIIIVLDDLTWRGLVYFICGLADRYKDRSKKERHGLEPGIVESQSEGKRILLYSTQQTQDVESMLVQRRSTVYDLGSTSNQH